MWTSVNRDACAICMHFICRRKRKIEMGCSRSER